MERNLLEMNSAYQPDAATQKILDYFEKLSAVPRQSGKEEKIRQYLIDWARSNKFLYITDKTGNLIIKVPASKGFEDKEPLILQGHLDMVCEKTPESEHDFDKDPIKLVTKGDWLHADQTTLGADNGIAIALAMCLSEDEQLKRPALELLFTVEEETGLTGAKELETGILSGTKLINLDSEDEGHFTVGCAGGVDTHIEFDVAYEQVPEDYCAMQIKISGLSGGHSGVNIHEERANAIKVLVRALSIIRDHCDLRLADISGGTAHNAIPRNAQANIFIPNDASDQIVQLLDELNTTFRNEYSFTDPNLIIRGNILAIPAVRRAMMSFVSLKVLDLLIALPHGVAARSTAMPGLVETSSNHARTWVADGKLYIQTSQRSSVMSRLQAITRRIEIIARMAGARVTSGNGYPAWQPDMNSPLLKKCSEIYEKVFNQAPKIEAIHAGLECGIIGSLHEDMDMISIGPTIIDPHSPDERMNIPSLEKIWKFLYALVQEL